jgi:hypothetical protein
MPARMATILTLTSTMLGKAQSSRNCPSSLMGMQSVSATLKASLVVSYKAKHTLTHPASTLLDIYTKEVKTCVHTKTCPWMFITALATIPKTRKQPSGGD